MPTKKPVKYRDRLIGELTLYTKEDWQVKDREPTEKDFLIMTSSMGADLTHEILEREPKQFDPQEPEMPWPIVIIREIATAYSDCKNTELEEEIMIMYTSKYGMDQLLGIWGADIPKLAEDIEKVLLDENGDEIVNSP
jgi:hypothetical protein